jgi:autotransporter-associated beta strand protein
MNDLNGLVIDHLAFRHHDFTINGNAVMLAPATGAAAIDHSDEQEDHFTVTINCGLVLGNDAKFRTLAQNNVTFGGINNCLGLCDDSGPMITYLNGPIDLNGHNLDLHTEALQVLGAHNPARLYLSGTISGTGNITAEITGWAGSDNTLEFNGPSGNTFSGSLKVSAIAGSAVTFNKGSGLVVNDWLAISFGTVRLERPEQIGPNAVVAINGAGLLHLKGNNQTIGTLSMGNVQADTDPAMVDTGGGLLGLNGGIRSSSDNNQVNPIIKGQLNLNGVVSFKVDGPTYPGLEIQAGISGPGGFSKSGNGALVLEGNNSFASSLEVDDGILDIRTASGLGAAPSTTLAGGSLTLHSSLGGSTLIVSGQQQITSDTTGSLIHTVGSISWGGPVLLNSSLVVVGDDISLTGQINGSGGFEFDNTGTAAIGGSDFNNYTGLTLVRCPVLKLNKPGNVRAYAGSLEVGGGNSGPSEARWLNSSQGNGGSLTLHADGVINLNNFNESVSQVTFNGGQIETGAGQLSLNGSVSAHTAATAAVISGNLQLLPPPPPSIAPGIMRARGPIGRPVLQPYNYFNVEPSGADCDLTVAALVSGSTQGLVKQGLGVMCLTAANTYTGPITVQGGVLEVDGSQPQSGIQVNAGARLTGIGAVGAITLAGDSAVVHPGLGTGILTCSSLSGSGTLELWLKGPNPGTDYSQLKTEGAVSLAGISLDAALFFPSPQGSQFMLIKSDGSGSIQGGFVGLPQGSVFNVDDGVFQISYAGGGGHDVVLTQVSASAIPKLSIELGTRPTFQVLWPTNAVGFSLQVNSSLGSSNWESVLPAPTVMGANYVVTATSSGAQSVYRLFKP